MPFNFPIFTWLRIVLIPLMIAVFYVPEAWLPDISRNLAAALIFIVAAARTGLMVTWRGAGTKPRPSAPFRPGG